MYDLRGGLQLGLESCSQLFSTIVPWVAGATDLSQTLGSPGPLPGQAQPYLAQLWSFGYFGVGGRWLACAKWAAVLCKTC